MRRRSRWSPSSLFAFAAALLVSASFLAPVPVPAQAAGEEAQARIVVDEAAVERYRSDVAWLAHDAREGRGVGTRGLDEAADWLVEQYEAIGLEPGVEAGNGKDGYRQSFDVPFRIEVGEGTALVLGEQSVPTEDFQPLGFSAEGEVTAEVVPVGYGITLPEGDFDDYEGVDVKGKIAAVRRFVPEGGPFEASEAQQRYSDLRYKAFNAREHGAVGLIVVDLPPADPSGDAAGDGSSGSHSGAAAAHSPITPPPSHPSHGSGSQGAGSHGEGTQEGSAHGDMGHAVTGHGDTGHGDEGADAGSEGGAGDEAPFPALAVDQPGDAGLPAVVVRREVAAPLFEGEPLQARISVALDREEKPAENIVGRLPAGAPEGERLPGAVLLGAHYDHLGFGGRGSLSPDSREPHNGADDNASGTAALLEAARVLAARRNELRRDVWFVAFSGEESGILGSTHLTRQPPSALVVEELAAMVNMDMVGRLRKERLSVLGGESAEEWAEIVDPACERARLDCDLGGEGYGPSDQTPFYAAGVPVLHLFTGVHDDYHRPSDDVGTVNAEGGARIAHLAADVALGLAGREAPLTYRNAPAPPPRGDMRSFGASLGTVPDYAGAPEGKRGVPISDVRPGSSAEKAGIQRGDLLVELGGKEIGDIYDFVFVLRQARPGQKATAVVERGGERVDLVVTYDASRGIR